jgi:hypothetical protein
MKQHVFAAAAAIVLGLLGHSSDAKAESCTELANNTARALVQQYCEDVKDAHADQVVIMPPPVEADVVFMQPGARGFSVELGRKCTRTHSLICKQRMADLVGRDQQCNQLLHQSFSFDIKDEFTGTSQSTDSMSYYQTLQLDGCRLH